VCSRNYPLSKLFLGGIQCHFQLFGACWERVQYIRLRIEAAASGCTIVTTATGGIKGILSRDVEGVDLLAGMFVVETDSVALSTALSQAFSPQLWTSRKVASRSEAMSNFHPELIASAYIAT
jgi:glycosyltransferase involved in cell wall biosynthesis